MMASDNNPKVQKMISQSFTIENFIDDVEKYPVLAMPGELDLYCCGFPCQPFSSAGINQALSDARAGPMLAMLKYIDLKKPTTFMLENVVNFADQHKNILQSVVKFLKKIVEPNTATPLYSVKCQILNTLDFSIPQDRRRLYIVGIKSKMMKSEFQWPTPHGTAPVLSTFWDRDRGG